MLFDLDDSANCDNDDILDLIEDDNIMQNELIDTLKKFINKENAIQLWAKILSINKPRQEEFINYFREIYVAEKILIEFEKIHGDDYNGKENMIESLSDDLQGSCFESSTLYQYLSNNDEYKKYLNGKDLDVKYKRHFLNQLKKMKNNLKSSE